MMSIALSSGDFFGKQLLRWLLLSFNEGCSQCTTIAVDEIKIINALKLNALNRAGFEKHLADFAGPNVYLQKHAKFALTENQNK